MTKREMVKTLEDSINEIVCSTNIKGYGSPLFESYIDRYSLAFQNIWVVLYNLKNLADEEDKVM